MRRKKRMGAKAVQGENINYSMQRERERDEISVYIYIYRMVHKLKEWIYNDESFEDIMLKQGSWVAME